MPTLVWPSMLVLCALALFCFATYTGIAIGIVIALVAAMEVFCAIRDRRQNSRLN
jgi:hypothetical protein